MKKVYLLPIFALLSGCSAAYSNNKAVCTGKAYAQYPEIKTLTNVTKFRSVKVPTGQTSCDSYRIGDFISTDCNQLYTTELQEYVEPQIIDINRSQRNSAIRNCVATACRATHNNQFCW